MGRGREMVVLEGLCCCGQEVSTSMEISCSYVENDRNVNVLPTSS